MPRGKPPPTFDTSKTRRQLDIIERDLKLTTKALQDRLGISKQGFVWKEQSQHNECILNAFLMTTFNKCQEPGELTGCEDDFAHLVWPSGGKF